MAPNTCGTFTYQGPDHLRTPRKHIVPVCENSPNGVGGWKRGTSGRRTLGEIGTYLVHVRKGRGKPKALLDIREVLTVPGSRFVSRSTAVRSVQCCPTTSRVEWSKRSSLTESAGCWTLGRRSGPLEAWCCLQGQQVTKLLPVTWL